MVLAEMNIDLTCPEDWFQASSPSEFLAAVQSNRWRKGRTPLLTEVVRDLFTNHSQPEECNLLWGASKLNLFTIASGKASRPKREKSTYAISAIHGLIFHEKMSFTQVSSSTGPIGTALERWGQAWEKVIATLPSSVVVNEAWKEDGFMQHAGEFAALARVHLQQNDPITSFTQDSMGSSDGGMATFDQTTMKTVSDLIQAVESLSLH